MPNQRLESLSFHALSGILTCPFAATGYAVGGD
jgi:hypothetical protein